MMITLLTAVTVGNMKKQLFIISIIIIIVSIFVACSANSSREDISTTAVTDSNGTTHFYEPVTDETGKAVTNENGDTIYAQIETQACGTPVTNKNGTYVTKEHTTVFPATAKNDVRNTAEENIGNTNTVTNSNSENQTAGADNEVPFEQTENNTSSTATTKNNTGVTTTTEQPAQTEKTTQSATDSDGWITKWY